MYSTQTSSTSDSRSEFITKTYLHVAGAIAAFTLIEVVLFKTGLIHNLAMSVMEYWYGVLGAFIIAGWLFSHIAHVAESKFTQYVALGAYVVIEAIIFAPLLLVAANLAGPMLIQSAAYVTLAAFAGLTAIAFITRKDFSFLKGFLLYGFVLAIIVIFGGMLFGFVPGFYFSVIMVGLAGLAILYDTSNIIHHYREDQYVGAALELFASVALMFWYVLRIAIALYAED